MIIIKSDVVSSAEAYPTTQTDVQVFAHHDGTPKTGSVGLHISCSHTISLTFRVEAAREIAKILIEAADAVDAAEQEVAAKAMALGIWTHVNNQKNLDALMFECSQVRS